MYINTKNKVGYYLFYAKNIEKYSSINNIKDKDTIAELIGKTFMIVGGILVVSTIIFIIFNIEVIFFLIPALISFVFYIHRMFKINKKILK